MIPSHRALVLALAWLLLGLVPVFVRDAAAGWWGVGGVLGILLLGDGLWGRLLPAVRVERRLPARFACGEEGEVEIVLGNSSGRRARLEVFDGIPVSAVTEELPWAGDIPGMRDVRVFYRVTLRERGEAVFSPVEVRSLSPMGLWWRQTRHLENEVVRVYPNYEPVVRFALLAMQHRESPLGVVRRPRGGASRDFHQLRDYRDGDALSQIDWKASSRRQVLISRDFQEQRDQSVVFLVDTGRRMRATEDGVPQFDHVLNAILFVAWMALRQGDQVAVKSFGGSDRWLPPVKGTHAMPVLLNHLYDYQTTAAASDFAHGVERLMACQRRRSLVILLTNLRGEDGGELTGALQVLRGRHVVLVASMREQVLQRACAEPVGSFEQALRHLAAERALMERREVMAALEAAGVLALDATPAGFPVALANRYHAIKEAGRL